MVTQGIKGLRTGEFLFDVGRSWSVLWRVFIVAVIAYILLRSVAQRTTNGSRSVLNGS